MYIFGEKGVQCLIFIVKTPLNLL